MRAIAWLMGAVFVFVGLIGAVVGFGGYYSVIDVPGQRVCLGVGVVSTLMLLWGWSLCNRAESGSLTDVSLSRFNRVRIGDGRNRCIDLLGPNGRHVTTSAKAIDGKIVERMQCFWDNANGSWAEVIFENDVVAEKSQVGLS